MSGAAESQRPLSEPLSTRPLDLLWPRAPRLRRSYSWPPRLSFRSRGPGCRTLCWESSCWGSTRLPTQTNPSCLFDGFTGRETPSSLRDSTPREAGIHDGASGERCSSLESFPIYLCFHIWQSRPHSDLQWVSAWTDLWRDKKWEISVCRPTLKWFHF